jgi:hypothetical protein
MNAAHQKLTITEEAFNEVARTLNEVLEDNGIDAADIGAIMDLAGSLKDEVVSA